MARPLRLEFEEAIYHITARGNRRERIFASDADRTRFLEILARSLARFEVELHAYVLLPNHFHLLVRTRRANLSRWMHRLSLSPKNWSWVNSMLWGARGGRVRYRRFVGEGLGREEKNPLTAPPGHPPPGGKGFSAGAKKKNFTTASSGASWASDVLPGLSWSIPSRPA